MLISSRWSRLPLFVLLLGAPIAAACTTGLVEVVPTASDAGTDGATPPAPTATTPSTTTDASAGGDGATPPTSLPVPSFDAGPPSCGTGPAVTLATLDEAFGGGWRGPGAPQQVCTQADIDNLKALFKSSQSVKFTDVKAALGATCAACAFRPASGATWGPFVDSSGGGTYQNYASCYALATNATCARDLAYFDACLRTTCDDATCGGAQATQACQKAAATNPCAAFSNAVKQSCGAQLDEVDQKCSNIFQVISATCGGGLDAAAPF